MITSYIQFSIFALIFELYSIAVPPFGLPCVSSVSFIGLVTIHSISLNSFFTTSKNLSGYNQCSCNKQKSDMDNNSETVSYFVSPRLLQLYEENTRFFFLSLFNTPGDYTFSQFHTSHMIAFLLYKSLL